MRKFWLAALAAILLFTGVSVAATSAKAGFKDAMKQASGQNIGGKI
ncbi:hypothetical protein [Mesorhizobium sp.]|nr:hypothetical protein [Mesorhizobium sp.]